MISAQEQTKREEFRSILYDLAKTNLSLEDKATRSRVYQRFENLYYQPNEDTHFRHFYSDIFSVLTTIQQRDRPGSIDILGLNLGEIRSGYQVRNEDAQGNPIDIRDELKKLYDHVSLDIARITCSDAADRRIGQMEGIAQVKNQMIQLQAKIESANEEMESQRKVVQDAQREYIAILGIFASIVLAFTAGIAFSTSVLENMHHVTIYRAVMIILLIGLVLINILYGLFYYISKLTKHGEGEANSIKPLLITNAVFLVLIIVTCIAWRCGVVEKRNDNMFQHSGAETTSTASELL